MTGAVVGAGVPRRGAWIIDRRVEDRWVGRPVRQASLAMSSVVLASLLIHAGLLVFAATFGEGAPHAQPQETVVELVREPAPEPKPREDKAETATPKAAEASKPYEAPKLEAPKPEQAKPEALKPEQAKPEQAKSEEPTPEPRQPEPNPHETKPLDPKAAEAKPTAPAEASKMAEKDATLERLQAELDSLKAEQDALGAEASSAPQAQAVDTPDYAMGALGLGAIPSSFGAVALPQLSNTEGEAAGYEQIVFSQLARAKGVRRHLGVAGTAGIVLTIDASGRLAKATLVHPSGSAALDDEAMQIVKAAAPFPKPPPGTAKTISANFNFVPQPAP